MESTAPTTPVVRVFGGIGVIDAGAPVSIGGPRQRRLLALLAIRPGAVVSIDWLAEHLWDDADRPEATAPALRTYVSRLRSSLPESLRDWIETEPSGYRLAAPAEAIEHIRFADLRARARRARDVGDPQEAHRLLDEALAMWRGDPFRELEDLDWARSDIERLRLDRLEMLEERWESDLALGRHTQIIGELAAFTAEHGMRDRAIRQYALALHRSGRTDEALRVVDDHRRRLAEESGLDLSAQTAELEQALLEGDPSLSVAPVGRPLRGYQLIEEIGSGAFSVVWRGVQPSVNREVAIKQIRSDLASQPEFIRRFEAEAHLVARIEHPHVVPLIDFWRDPDSAYLVMRWLKGGTLERRLDDGPVSLADTLQIARQIGGALATAHAHGIVHRDVTAGNVLFDEAGNAFLTDFGIALEAAESASPEAALSPGSVAYSAPEQIRRERLQPSADVFSLGVVIFECLTGSLPFSDIRSVEQLVDQQMHTPYPTLAELRVDVPDSVSAAVAMATAKNPSDRFSSIQEFVSALDVSTPSTELLPEIVGEPANPYRGLRPFDEADASEFFGRERLVTEIVGRLSGGGTQSRAVVIVGPSGSGKSSAVRAGLLPALRKGAVPGSDEWFMTTMVPGGDPFESLETALLRVAVNPPDSLLDQLRDGDRGILRATRRCLETDNGRVLVVIDQLEELFTTGAPEDVRAFLSALSIALEDPTSPLRVVAIIRADYYDRPLEHPAFAGLVKVGAIEITPLAGDELERAIVEPARRAGVEYEPGLVARIAAETVGQPSPLPLLQYMLRELFERRSGRTLTLDNHTQLGGLAGALADRAEGLHDDATAEQRAGIRRLFGRLTNPTEETTDLRRRVAVTDVGTDAATQWALNQFSTERLLTFDRDPATREPTVEVAHEALLREWPRLVGWLVEDRELLRAAGIIASGADAWVESGKAEADLYRGGRLEMAIDIERTHPERLRGVDRDFIAASCVAAERADAAERSRVRRLRRLVAGTAAALAVAVIAGGFALREQGRARDEAERAAVLAEQETFARQEADAQAALAAEQAALAEEQSALASEHAVLAEEAARQAELATIISRSAALASENPEVATLLALEAHRRDPNPETQTAVLNALGSGELPNRVASLEPLAGSGATCGVATISADGLTEFGIRGGVMVTRDTSTGAISEHGEAPTCGRWIGDALSGRRFILSNDGQTMQAGPFDGPWEVERRFDHEMILDSRSIPRSNRLLFVSFPDGVASVDLLDASTLEPVISTLQDGNEIVTVDNSDDGSLIVLGWARFRGAAGDGYTVVLDGATGEQLFEFDSDVPASRVAFDDDAGQVIVALLDGTFLTLDLATQQVVGVAEYPTTSRLHDIGVRADGLIVAVSASEIALVDRLTGPTGDVVDVANAADAVVLAEGTVLLLSPDNGVDVIDLAGNALVERSWRVDPLRNIAVGAGQATATAFNAAAPTQIIDLETGVRTPLELALPDGTAYAPFVVWPTDGSLWAMGLNLNTGSLEDPFAFTRWVDGTLADVIEPGFVAPGAFRAGDAIALTGLGPDGEPAVGLLSLDPADPGLRFTVPAPDVWTARPAADGGAHVLEIRQDRLLVVRSYDAAGDLMREITVDKPEGVTVGNLAVADATGDVAIATGSGVVVIDAETDQVDTLADLAGATELAFSGDGELLVVSGGDGTVRLWNLVGGASAGLVWDGTGRMTVDAPWYDEVADSMWVATSGRLLAVPLNPDRWVGRACEVVARDLTQDEWDRYVPGSTTVESACR